MAVLPCGNDEDHVGAIEIWHNDAQVSADLSLHEGHYGSAELFKWRSAQTRFRMGIGLPDTGRHERLKFDTGDCDLQPDFAATYAQLGVTCGDGIIGQAWVSGIPVVRDLNIPDPSTAAMSARQTGLSTMIAIPMIHQGHLTSVVARYW